jgi:ABC-2 type transport system ATP-binding protein
MINARGLSKQFISFKKAPGLSGAVRSFFHPEKIYKDAVKQFDLDIKQGEMIGLLGPNGAGKTTLMKMFTGIIVPSCGELSILGYSPAERQKAFRQKIALVMGQKSQLWWDIPAMDSFLLLQKYYEIPKKDFELRVKEMSELLGVVELLHIHVRRLSLGERMKLELMASLLHSPEVIFLDEPTIGLDLVAQENIREFIREYHRKHNATLILTSHYMADVQALCERLVLIFDGQKVYDGSLGDFENILGHEKSVSLSFSRSQNSSLFSDYSPIWNDEKTQVELRVPECSWNSFGKDAFQIDDLVDFNTEKLPIEKVMKTLMTNPDILRQMRT